MNWTRQVIFALYFTDSVKSQIFPSESNEIEVFVRDDIIPSTPVPEVFFLLSATTASGSFSPLRRLHLIQKQRRENFWNQDSYQGKVKCNFKNKKWTEQNTPFSYEN